MTREEAIARIQEHMIAHKMKEPRAILISKALDMAVNALKQEPCEDAISRKAVLDIWHTSYSDNREENDEIQYKKIAFELPSVTPIREHGEWIKVTNGRGGHECSQCGHYAPSYQNGAEHLSDFCPKCGADMRKEQNNV